MLISFLNSPDGVSGSRSASNVRIERISWREAPSEIELILDSECALFLFCLLCLPLLNDLSEIARPSLIWSPSRPVSRISGCGVRDRIDAS